MSVATIAGIVAHTPAGALVDVTRVKRPVAFTARIGRNETFNHAGNAVAAAIGVAVCWIALPEKQASSAANGARRGQTRPRASGIAAE